MKHLFYKFSIVLTGIFMACSPNSELADDTITNTANTTNTEAPKGMTTFGGTQTNQQYKKRNVPVTRTSLEHSDVGVASNPFYWELGDNLWVKKSATELVQSSSSDITKKVATARFYFDGLFDQSTYQVYYRGNNTDAGNKVTIATQQTQNSPNNSTHLGASGDCGTATATRGSDGIYGFSLLHKAAYLCITPRMTDANLGANTRLMKVKIVSDQTIAGTYDFSDGSLKTPTSTSNEITITCGTNGFPLTGISASEALAKAGVYAVIAPGTHKLRLEYTIKDIQNNNEGIAYQYINQHTFAENNLVDIVVDLNTRIVDISQFKYYRWDAQKDVFADQANPPHLNNEIVNYTEGSRYNFANTFEPAAYSQKDAPNINETLWYVQHGDPMTEEGVPYKYNGHLYKGIGLWIKKQAHISNFSKVQAPDGKDYRTELPANETPINCNIGRPADPSQYFFIPAMGGVKPNGTNIWDDTTGTLLEVATSGYYWTSTASQAASPNYYAYLLYFTKGKYCIYYKGGNGNLASRRFGFSNWKGE